MESENIYDCLLPRKEEFEEDSRRLCRGDARTWLLIHSLIVVIPTCLLLSIVPYRTLCILLIFYAAIVLSAGFYNHTISLKITRVLAHLTSSFCMLLFLCVPSVIGFFRGYLFQCSEDALPKRKDVYNVVYEGLFIQLVTAIFTLFWLAQGWLTEAVLELKKNRKNDDFSTKKTTIV